MLVDVAQIFFFSYLRKEEQGIEERGILQGTRNIGEYGGMSGNMEEYWGFNQCIE